MLQCTTVHVLGCRLLTAAVYVSKYLLRLLKANGVKTQWRAEKLYVQEGEHFVEHKLVTICMS